MIHTNFLLEMKLESMREINDVQSILRIIKAMPKQAVYNQK